MCHDLSKISNGFTIELLTNSDINWINPLAAVYTKIKSRILAANVEIYEYQSNIPKHTKTITIDEQYSIIGSYNFDNRSTYIDTELMLVINCPYLTNKLNIQMKQVKENCIKINSSNIDINLDLKKMSIIKRIYHKLLCFLFYPFEYLI